MLARRLCLAFLLVLTACSASSPPEPSHLVFHLERTAVPDEDVRVGLQTVQRRLDAFHVTDARMVLSGDSLVVTVGPASNVTYAQVAHVIAGPGRLRLSAPEQGLTVELHPFSTINRSAPHDLEVTLAEEDVEAVESLTRQAIGQRVVLTLDDEVLFQPVAKAALTSRQVVLSSPDQATLDRLDAMLSAGPLPAGFRLTR